MTVLTGCALDKFTVICCTLIVSLFFFFLWFCLLATALSLLLLLLFTICTFIIYLCCCCCCFLFAFLSRSLFFCRTVNVTIFHLFRIFLQIYDCNGDNDYGRKCEKGVQFKCLYIDINGDVGSQS